MHKNSISESQASFQLSQYVQNLGTGHSTPRGSGQQLRGASPITAGKKTFTQEAQNLFKVSDHWNVNPGGGVAGLNGHVPLGSGLPCTFYCF